MIFAMFVCGLAIAFSIRWLLTIIIFGSLPFLGITGFLFIYLIELKNTKFLQFYEKSGSRA
jgi:ABC-type bacteriocin/lantibiotic exporter with double-glycine peptidase domain